MKKKFKVTSLFFIVAVFLVCGACTQEKIILNKTVLKINSTQITTKEFSERLALKLKDFDALAVKDETHLKRAKDQVAETFVIEEITRNYAAKNNVNLDAKEVDEAIASIRSRYPDDNAFRRSLAQENMPYEAWRKDFELSMLQKKVFKHVSAAIVEPTEAEIKQYYDANKPQFTRPARVQLRQIVLEKEEDARRILAELSDGGDFAKLAKEFSVAPEGENGGNTGWIEKGTLDVFDQAFKMSVGSRSKVIKSPYGYHIYDLVKKESEAHLSLADAKAKIRSRLIEQRGQKAFSSWLEQEVRNTKVSRNEELIKSIKVTTRGN